MKKPGIPDIPATGDFAVRQLLQALKMHLETLEGRRGGRIAELTVDAELADVISKVNEILQRLQD